MKSAPIVLAFVAICATGFAIPPQSSPSRTKTIPIPEPVRITVDQLAVDIDRGKAFDESQLPEAVKQLIGKRVLIVGRMNMIRPADPVANFVFNGYTNKKPNYLDPGIQFFIPVTMTAGTATPITLDPIEIEGRLVIRPRYHNGILSSLYEVEDASVEPTERPEGSMIPVLPIFGC